MTWSLFYVFVFIIILYLSMTLGLIWYLFVKKSVNQLYILISFGSGFQMMMTPQLSGRLNKERSAWIPLAIQWVGLLVCMNAMVLEETRCDDSYSDCCTFVQFSAMMAILEAFSLLKVMVCLLLNMAATYCNKHTFFVIMMNSVYGPLNVCLIHAVWIYIMSHKLIINLLLTCRQHTTYYCTIIYLSIITIIIIIIIIIIINIIVFFKFCAAVEFCQE